MKMVVVIALIMSWLFSGAVGGGFFLAALRAEYPSIYKDPHLALTWRNKIIATSALFGPAGLLVLGATNGFGYPDGWTWTAEPIGR